MKKLVFILIGFVPLLTPAQEVLTLEECYALVEKNYPLATKAKLLEEKANFDIKVLEKDRLPKLDINAQATYQSDVIEFPGDIPNANFETPNKDQYRATMDANQLIYNGGSIAARASLKNAEMKTLQQEVAVNLYELKGRINKNYFNVLLFQEQINLLQSKMEQLEARVKEVESGVKYGAVLASSQQVLQAEILKLEQQVTEADFTRIKALNHLSQLLATNLNERTNLVKPNIFINVTNDSDRPEVKLFELQQQQLETSKTVIEKANYPKLLGFAQAGYGNPGLNMLENSFEDFYMVGLKVNWNIFDWGKTKQQKKAVDISKEMITTEKETFKLNNSINIKEAMSEINKYRELLQSDSGIIEMRKKVLEATTVQFQNGAITSSEYITELNNLYEAEINQDLHEVQLLLAKANYKMIKGDLNQ
ncbi:TolC family protein [Salegentibacter salegens]|uniref:Outer membrane protein TolC n=1 Tax=Salegentibacter salegens TaxID=143223 RepID=A0A1M7KVH4_9FLAO|nr:TolC family protein [Salegentibacter salegens]PRX43830.1 outer membrane protein TolC [Salegentibacter salegens]SHM69612.1 Outer membrane protein TolC [Salegentibacter salegens]